MEPNVICFWCRQHVNPGELANGQHNHMDDRERLAGPGRKQTHQLRPGLGALQAKPWLPTARRATLVRPTTHPPGPSEFCFGVATATRLSSPASRQ